MSLLSVWPVYDTVRKQRVNDISDDTKRKKRMRSQHHALVGSSNDVVVGVDDYCDWS